MPSSIKLTYFDARGRAETSRLILAFAGAAFEDERLTGQLVVAIISIWDETIDFQASSSPHWSHPSLMARLPLLTSMNSEQIPPSSIHHHKQTQYLNIRMAGSRAHSGRHIIGTVDDNRQVEL